MLSCGGLGFFRATHVTKRSVDEQDSTTLFAFLMLLKRFFDQVQPPSWNHHHRYSSRNEESSPNRIVLAQLLRERSDRVDSSIKGLLPGEANTNTDGIDDLANCAVSTFIRGIQVLEPIQEVDQDKATEGDRQGQHHTPDAGVRIRFSICRFLEAKEDPFHIVQSTPGGSGRKSAAGDQNPSCRVALAAFHRSGRTCHECMSSMIALLYLRVDHQDRDRCDSTDESRNTDADLGTTRMV
mmetsp:Transcript_66905/g.156850  ORF Transcript_66905/g.156850 Transcript_66905/m.156850 type:complete len:239 (+) Transcript_66905:125-841(+)